MSKGTIVLKATGYYPCQWDDLIDEQRRTRATVYTLEDAGQDGFTEPGITPGEDGVYDIVIDVPELTGDIVRKALQELSRIAGVDYELQGDSSGDTQ